MSHLESSNKGRVEVDWNGLLADVNDYIQTIKPKYHASIVGDESKDPDDVFISVNVDNDSIHHSIIARLAQVCKGMHIYLSGSDDLNIFIVPKTYEESEEERIRQQFSYHVEVGDIVGSRKSGFLYEVVSVAKDAKSIWIRNNIKEEPFELTDEEVKEQGDNWFIKVVRPRD